MPSHTPPKRLDRLRALTQGDDPTLPTSPSRLERLRALTTDSDTAGDPKRAPGRLARAAGVVRDFADRQMEAAAAEGERIAATAEAAQRELYRRIESGEAMDDFRRGIAEVPRAIGGQLSEIGHLIAGGLASAVDALSTEEAARAVGSGLLPRDPAEREALGLRPLPERTPTNLASAVRRSREQAREFYGEPETPIGQTAAGAARFVGEGALFMAPGVGAARALSAAPAATAQGGRLLRLLASPHGFRQRAAQNIITGAPLDAVIGLGAEPDESMVGFAGELLDSEALRRASEHPAGRVAGEVGLGFAAGEILGEGLHALGRLRGGAREAAGQMPAAAPPDPESRRRTRSRVRRRIAAWIDPELAREATTDPLTGALNRGADERATADALRERAPGTRTIRYRIDLDNFKALNDELGHAAGDEALRVVTQALRQQLRPDDVVSLGRPGGDEFAITMRIADDADPAAIRDRLEAAIDEALERAELAVVGDRRVGASIGYAEATEGMTVSALDEAADAAAIARKAERGISRPRMPEQQPVQSQTWDALEQPPGVVFTDPMERFVRNRSGGLDFGEIDAETARQIRREAAPIRLTPERAEHIWQQHAAELRALGYERPEDFVEDVARGFTEIRQGSGNSLLLVRPNGLDRVLVVRLAAEGGESIYNVRTGYPQARGRTEKKELLGRPARRGPAGEQDLAGDLASARRSPGEPGGPSDVGSGHAGTQQRTSKIAREEPSITEGSAERSLRAFDREQAPDASVAGPTESFVAPREQPGTAGRPGPREAEGLTGSRRSAESTVTDSRPADKPASEPPTAPDAPSRHPGGFFNLGALRGVRGFFRRNFTTAGDLPRPIFTRKIKRDGWISSQLRQVAYTLRDFEAALKEVYGGKRKMTPEQLRAINDALSGEVPGQPKQAPLEDARLAETRESARQAVRRARRAERRALGEDVLDALRAASESETEAVATAWHAAVEARRSARAKRDEVRRIRRDLEDKRRRPTEAQVSDLRQSVAQLEDDLRVAREAAREARRAEEAAISQVRLELRRAAPGERVPDETLGAAAYASTVSRETARTARSSQRRLTRAREALRKAERRAVSNEELEQLRAAVADARTEFEKARRAASEMGQAESRQRGRARTARQRFRRADRRFRRAQELRAEADAAIGHFQRSRREVMEAREARAREAIEALPEELRPVVARMRAELDALSRRMIDSGVVEGELAVRVDENMGMYLNRSYRVFDDPKWADNVPEDVRNRAKSWLRSEYPEASPEEIDGLINELLFRSERDRPVGPIAVLSRGSKLGSKNLSILKRRKDIPPEIRALWGEYEDPLVNYARSVQKMTHLIANHEFLTDVRRAHRGEIVMGQAEARQDAYFFDRPIVRDGVSYHARFSAEGSDALAPLNGLYTTPEIKAAFERAVATDAAPEWLRLYMKANGTVKFAKTVLSAMTHIRNVIGNVGFAAANGHWRLAHAGKAWKATWTNLAKRPDTEWRAYYRRLQELGVVDESVHSGELRDVIRDASRVDPREYTESVIERGAKRFGTAVTDAYRAEDDIWKVFAFENEVERYSNALGVPREQVEEMAAEIVRNTYPTYSLVPEGVKVLRRSPLLGTFVSFPAEVIRTAYNTLELTARELRDPRLRSIGAERLAGLVVAATGVPAMAAASRFMLGIDRKTDEDVRKFLPPWSENSNLVYMGRSPDGNIRFVDLSYTDPYSYLRTPLIAFMRGGDWESAVLEAGVQALKPFLGEEILAGKLLDVSRNQKGDGGRVYNPQAPLEQKISDVISHVWDAVEPGTITSMRRIGMGLTGRTTIHGRAYDPKVEAAAVFTGHRLQELDVAQALSFRARDVERQMTDARRLLTAVASRRGEVTADELIAAYFDMEFSRRALIEGAHDYVTAAVRLGVPERQVQRILAGAGLSRADIRMALDGEWRPYRPGDQFLTSVLRSVESLVEGDEDRAEARRRFAERRRIIGQLAAQVAREGLPDRRLPGGKPPALAQPSDSTATRR